MHCRIRLWGGRAEDDRRFFLRGAGDDMEKSNEPFEFPVSSDNIGNLNQSTDRLEFSARNNTEGLQMNQPIEFENALKCFARLSKRAADFDIYAR